MFPPLMDEFPKSRETTSVNEVMVRNTRSLVDIRCPNDSPPPSLLPQVQVSRNFIRIWLSASADNNLDKFSRTNLLMRVRVVAP